MAELYLLSSAAFSMLPFYQDQATFRSSKEISATLSGFGNSRGIFKSASVLIGSPIEEKSLPKNLFPTYYQPQRSIPIVEKPVLIDAQDAHPDSALLSFGIAEECARREKMQKFLLSGLNEEHGLDTSLLSNLMGLKTVAFDTCDIFSLCEVRVSDSDYILHSARQFQIPKPLLEFFTDGSNGANIAVLPDGLMLLSGGESEIKDLLSVAAEFNMLKSFTTRNKPSMVVPYFTNEYAGLVTLPPSSEDLAFKGCKRRSRGGHARTNSQVSVLANQTAALSKSPENIKLKPLPKKKQRKNAARERDLYQKNYFRACENLVSVVVLDKRRSSTVILSLKKSAPEITELLARFSAGIAGTGLAILLYVASKAATGRMPLNSAKILNIGLAIGFFWLSCAVNRLRETVTCISRSSNKLKLTDEKMIGQVDGSVAEVLFRASALVAIVLLRFVW